MLSSLAALLAIVVLGVPLLAYLGQDRLLFYPQPLDAAAREAVGRRFPAARAPAKAPGIGWLLTSYRGYGGSEGSPSAAALAADAKLWHDYATQELKPSQLFAFGRSIGSGPAVALAAARPLAGLVLVTPFDSLAAVAKRHYPYLPVEWLLKHRFDSVVLAPKITTPLLCFAAEQDTVIPAEHAKRLFDAWAGPKLWQPLAGAGHNSTDEAPAFWRGIAAFLRDPGM